MTLKRTNYSSDPNALVEALQGAWRAVYSEADGRMSPVEEFAALTHRFERNGFSVEGGAGRHAGTFSLDMGKSPTEVVYIYKESDGPFLGAPRRGLIQLEGDTLKLCMGPIGQDAPTDFNTGSGSQTVLTVFQKLDSNENLKVTAAALDHLTISQW
ncbi:TIGR03067 domain-containing protein [Streptomyces sp. NPDC048357]|uniref:TIGR03067 domain-containing protein n=1 Tax=Streptomyces sp. NPDC048357 TaxID=3154719 RepID=UPI003419CE25